MKQRSAKLITTGLLVAGLATPFAANADHNDGDWIIAVGTALTLAHYYEGDHYYPRQRYHSGYHDRHHRSQKHWRKHQRRAHSRGHGRAHKRGRHHYSSRGFAGGHSGNSGRRDHRRGH
jgi:hypothetical protein